MTASGRRISGLPSRARLSSVPLQEEQSPEQEQEQAGGDEGANGQGDEEDKVYVEDSNEESECRRRLPAAMSCLAAAACPMAERKLGTPR